MDDGQLSVVEKETLGECFASAEARFEYEKARRLRLVAMLVGGVVLLLGFGVFMYWLGGGGRFLPAAVGGAEAAGDEHKHGKLGAEPVGSPEAKVQVITILPEGSNCHAGVSKFLAETAAKHPERIRVEFVTMAEYGEKRLAEQIGTVCAAILINGASTFKVKCSSGKTHMVNLVGSEPMHYTSADVGEALTAVFVEQYGDPGAPIYQTPAGVKCKGGNGPTGPAAAAVGTSHSGPDDHTAPPVPKGGEALELPDFREIKSKP
jgi:hypothetical protein